ncbi:hypothetical protein HY633_03750 [Candidatus Uhrbacteria bacterium]|nr:hypothetical protein [Candidatus Uhrbacteria bacterium]
MAAGKFKVELKVNGEQGKPKVQQVEVNKSGAKLGEVLKEAGVSAKNKDLYVNDKPATLDTFVGPGDRALANVVSVKVEERPQGS